MKSGIHPTVHKDAKVVCTSCSAEFIIPSIEKETSIEVCSNCHPVYTGKFRTVSTSRRVERFQKKMAVAKQTEAENKDKKKKTRNLTPEEKLERKLEESRIKKEEKLAAEALKKKSKEV